MGLLDMLVGKRSTVEDSEERGYVEAMIMMIAADGVIEDEEVQDFLKNVYRNDKLSGVPQADMVSMLKRSLAAIENEGVDNRIKKISNMLNNTQSRKDALKMCLSICASDGDIAPEELEILKKMQNTFEISEVEIGAILKELGIA